MAEKIIIGSDHGGYNLKQTIIKHLNSTGYETEDLGCYSAESCDYPVIAKDVSKKVLETGSKGILVCGTGIGMSIQQTDLMESELLTARILLLPE